MRAAIAALVVLVGAGGVAAPAQARRGIPDTSGRIHVWLDQLPDDMTDAQVRFVAQHVDGTQKVSKQTAGRLRAIDHGFLVLHYRLGIGDGPVPFRIGTRWASDYSAVKRHDSWFWHTRGKRVFQKTWHWYLMNPVSGWRAYWAKRVFYEARLLGDDGVFADSLSVPQYLGADSFDPPFQYFVGEAAWTARIDSFMRYEEQKLRGKLWFIPNAGSMITTRDRTDYSIPDGVMVEGFAEGSAGNVYALSDWALQMNRVLRLAHKGRVVIGQSYLSPSDATARGFVLASYLLTKGTHSFVNMSIGTVPQWFPEYGVNLGKPLTALPGSIDALRTVSGLYVRTFANGLVIANPDGQPRDYPLDGTWQRVEDQGGGEVSGDGAADTTVATSPVSGTLRLPPHSGAILLR